MEHTFLFTEGEWRADGIYFTGGGETLAARGRTTVSHEADVWINDGLLVIGEEGGDRFRWHFLGSSIASALRLVGTEGVGTAR